MSTGLEDLYGAIETGKHYGFDSGNAFYRAMDAAADRMAKEYMELPKDSGGLPLKLGDLAQVNSPWLNEVIAIASDGRVELEMGNCSTGWFDSRNLHKHEPDTRERMLSDVNRKYGKGSPEASYAMNLVDRAIEYGRGMK